MADNHRPLRLPLWLWQRYGGVVGDVGRTPDLKIYMDWQIDNPDVVLGPDVAPPHDFLATLRVEPARWEMFMATVGNGGCAERMRRYVWWRVQNPDLPLPGRRLGPLRRQSRAAELV